MASCSILSQPTDGLGVGVGVGVGGLEEHPDDGSAGEGSKEELGRVNLLASLLSCSTRGTR